ncbi:PHB depolymerase family esterase, partial [Colletotrichum sp. SAR11_59]
PGDLDGRKPDDDDAADEHDFDGQIDDDNGGRRVRIGTAMGPMRRHQLDGCDFLREPVHLHQGQ